MRVTARLVPLFVAFVGVCCGGGSSTAPSPTTLAGTWKASRAEFASASNSGVKVEAVSQGYSIVLTLESGGTYKQVVTAPGESGQTTTGSWSASSDVLTLRQTGISGNTQFDMALNGTTLSLSGGHVQFDINGDNVDEETILNLTMTRQ